MSKSTISHYLVGYYTTHQPDSVHIEAHCTCGVKFEGVGQNKSTAMSALWILFRTPKKGKSKNRESCTNHFFNIFKTTGGYPLKTTRGW
jgi:hypothetical protein